MKRTVWVWCALSLLTCLCAGAWAAASAPLRLDHGWRLSLPQDTSPTLVPHRDTPGWQPVSMPDRQALPHAVPGFTVWYRFEIPADGLPAATNQFYLPRVQSTGRDTLSVYLDGVAVHDGSTNGGFLHFNLPMALKLPAASALDGNGRRRTAHEVLLKFTIDSPRGGYSLAAPWVGNSLQMRFLHQAREWAQVDGPRAASLALLLLGCVALFTWTQRRSEWQYFQFGLLTCLFFFRCLHYHSFIPWTDYSGLGHWFTWGTVNSLAWITALAVRMASHFHPMPYPRAEPALWAAVAMVSVMTTPWVAAVLPALAYSPWLYLLHVGITVGAIALLAHAAWQSGSRYAGALAGVLAVNLAFGVHDLLLRMGRLDPALIYLLPYGGLAMFAVMLHAMATTHSTALARAESAASSLEIKLAERETQVRQAQEQLREAEKVRVLADERQRLMGEMHDGLGSSLASTLMAAQSGRASGPALAHMVAEAIDELRLTIDSLDPLADDPLLLLATLRYRLAPRLEAAGIELQWQIHQLPDISWLSPTHARHLLRLLQESLANVVKHAKASQVRVFMPPVPDGFCIAVHDNGVGFDEATAHAGRGLGNLQRRLSALGGRLHMQSVPGSGTTLEFHLPS